MTKKYSIKDYAKLGKTLEATFQGGYINHWRVYKINFVRGLFFGTGAALGGTIIIALLIWLLGLFTNIPLLGAFIEAVRDTIDS